MVVKRLQICLLRRFLFLQTKFWKFFKKIFSIKKNIRNFLLIPNLKEKEKDLSPPLFFFLQKSVREILNIFFLDFIFLFLEPYSSILQNFSLTCHSTSKNSTINISRTYSPSHTYRENAKISNFVDIHKIFSDIQNIRF